MRREATHIDSLYEKLQGGLPIRCRTGISVYDFLCIDLGLNPDYVNERITTVFLDGSCVDDLKTAIIKDGSILALSSAMPGLAGATMRRGSIYASLRNSITYSEKCDSTPNSEGTITVKLFNVLLKELGPALIERSITVYP